ncbi:rhamnosyl/mannosyltransferase [Quadrisphaera granulorum]|uniref:Rhamnosyl/mannosyltransferase n=1 Tax=Quadrisphaera granulorum TaxID=317664 RepID=A0A316ADP8_9ACTN|nr:glycosyltransferase family 4 protein [Quadrisphaera granulorum]PWJ55732.1 rhamnosyl/mannosyltransferase [Quadrisphaera granulorum]SZE95229.1 rhamnosyl/mannosyltransferase [Quadrisphaera granulorum]
MSAAADRLLVLSGYYPPHVGGVEVCAQRYAEALARRGWAVHVLTSTLGASPDRTERPRKNPTPGQVVVSRLEGWEVAHTPLLPGLLTAAWRAARGATVHLHTGHATTDVAAWVAARLRRSPLVVHFHMDLPASGVVGAVVLPLYKRWVLSAVLRSATRVVVLTDAQREHVVGTHGVRPERVAVVPNGVDELFAALPRSERRSDEPLRVLSVCRLVPQKEPGVLLQSLALTGGALTATLVGDGELAPALADLADELDLGERLRLTGALSGKALHAEFSAAQVFVVTSAVEGMPLALLEAMAAGLTPVVRDLPELRSVVGDAGVLVPVDDPADAPAAFAAALDALAADPARCAELGRAARVAAAGRTWEQSADLLDDVLLAEVVV